METTKKSVIFPELSLRSELRNRSYIKISGVGLLFVKPLENDKASILVRADNTLGEKILRVESSAKNKF